MGFDASGRPSYSSAGAALSFETWPGGCVFFSFFFLGVVGVVFVSFGRFGLFWCGVFKGFGSFFWGDGFVLVFFGVLF